MNPARSTTGNKVSLSRVLKLSRLVGYVITVLVVIAMYAQEKILRVNHDRFHALVEQYRAADKPVSLADLNGGFIADEDDAAPLWLAASAAIDRGTPEWRRLNGLCWSDGPRDELEAASAAAVAANGKALGLARRAATRPAAQWVISWRTARTSVDPMPEVRTVGRLLHAAAVDAHRRGDDAMALGYVAQELALAHHVRGRAGTFEFAEVATCLGHSAVDAAARISAELSVDDAAARDAAATLASQLVDDRPWVRGLRLACYGERALVIDDTRALLAGRLAWADVVSGELMGGPAGESALRPRAPADAVVMMRAFDQMSAACAAADWPAAEAAIDRVQAGVGRDVYRHPWSTCLFPSPSLPFREAYRFRTERHLVGAAIALRLYEHGHGRLPPTLEALVPEWLPGIPADPMRRGGGGLRYLPTNVADPIVYSVGDDGIDDGGSDGPTTKYPTDFTSDVWERRDAVLHLRQWPGRLSAGMPVAVRSIYALDREP